MGGRVDNAFCAVRPPGHHAERNRAMGFCFFNNVAISTVYALEKYGLERVAIIDWDLPIMALAPSTRWRKTPGLFRVAARRPSLLLSRHRLP